MNQQRKIVSLQEEPKELIYEQLISWGSTVCSEAILVVRQSMPLDEFGLDFLAQTTPFLKKKLQSQSWPGTHLLGKKAWVYHYYLVPEFKEILLQTTSYLYKWLQPKLPEDLCLIRSDGEPWLVTISHEKDSYLILSEDEVEKIFLELPSLEGILKRID